MQVIDSMTPKSIPVESNGKNIMSSPGDGKIPDNITSLDSSDDGFNEFMKVLSSADSVKSTVSFLHCRKENSSCL